MSFVIPKEERNAPESPEALFRELRPRDPNVRDLLLRQGDALRAYRQLDTSSRDVAIELPTGAGKTLAGLLIAEWRRQYFSQRVAYLCPTVQLARQVSSKADSYGLDVVTLVRSHTTWDRSDVNAYTRGKAICIATYAAIFNSDPKLQNAQTLILDDAHGGEQAVASTWSVAVSRENDRGLYDELLSLVADALPSITVQHLRDDLLDPVKRSFVELVPPTTVADRAADLERAVHTHCPDGSHSSFFAMRALRHQLGRCLMYASWNEILIRPLIPPTLTHPAFASAEQRIYMSATLGASGELERAFGVPSMTRVQVSQGADERGFGRRFFVLPSAAHPPAVADELIRKAIKTAGRAVVLAPSFSELDRFEASCIPPDARPISADDVESDLAEFTRHETAVLMLANRYDGIDLPDDHCRLVVLTGLPATSHLQERFLLISLNAQRVLSERIRTRLIQGAGRATRGSRDFAAVLIRGEKLTDFCARDEELAAMPAQIQTELRFGLENSENPDTDPLALLASFWEQDDRWQVADAHLSTETARTLRSESEAAKALGLAAEAEVLSWQAAWSNDLAGALTHALTVVDRLSGGQELRAYRALWSYLAAGWAVQLGVETRDETYNTTARRQLDAAVGAARGLGWHPRLPELGAPEADDAATDPSRSRANLAATAMRELGIRGARFSRRLAEVATLLASDRSKEFEQGLEGLGKLLGFVSVRPNGQANPDGVWNDDDETWILFEAKTEEKPDVALTADAVRQAESHRRWVERELRWTAPRASLTVIVSPRATIDPAAATVADEQVLVAPDAIRDVARRCFATLNEIRVRARALDDEGLASELSALFLRDRLDTPSLLAELGGRKVSDG